MTSECCPSPLVAIVGPTASGKSAVAEELGMLMAPAAVVSVDAMQVYRGMDIGTAKTPAEARNLDLYMVDMCDVDKNYSAELFQKDARTCIDTLSSKGIQAILCGGTGLYLNAVIDKMDFPKGNKDSKQRKYYEQFLAEKGEDALYALLLEKDETSAALIHPHNSRRVIRALEMLDEGVRYADQVQGLHEHEAFYHCSIWGLDWDRSVLYQRIDKRVDSMLEEGLLDEVKTLKDCGLSRDVSAGQAIGYKELLDYLDGLTNLDEAVHLIKKRSRNYSKRQLSWFRRDSRISWIRADDKSAAALASEIYAQMCAASSI